MPPHPRHIPPHSVEVHVPSSAYHRHNTVRFSVNPHAERPALRPDARTPYAQSLPPRRVGSALPQKFRAPPSMHSQSFRSSETHRAAVPCRHMHLQNASAHTFSYTCQVPVPGIRKALSKAPLPKTAVLAETPFQSHRFQPERLSPP